MSRPLRAPANATGRDLLAPALPHNLEAERSILGAILLDNDALGRVTVKLRPEDFFLAQHRRIFQSMIEMRERNQGIDLVTLTDELDRSTHLENAGGIAYLSQLADGLPRVTNVEHYASIVKRKAVRRAAAFFAQALEARALEDGDLDETLILARAMKDLSTICDASRPWINWCEKFHTIEELSEGDIAFLIDRILPEGVTFIGASSGTGKTWFSLSMSRALTTGQKFLGVWNVLEPQNVLYLCPEMQSRPFKKRCTRLAMASERFRCQTISDGAALDLADPVLLAAVRDLRPIVFLDTSIRFSSAESENSATDNQPLARAIFSLIHAGAKAVVCLHHRSKDAARADEMTLENVLRGTTDSGAIADAVFGLKYDQLDGSAAYAKESRKLVRLEVRCVKARDFTAPEDFRIQLNPFLDDHGDFAVLADVPPEKASESERLSRAIAENPKATKVELQATTGIGRNRIGKLAAAEGWHYESMTGWEKT